MRVCVGRFLQDGASDTSASFLDAHQFDVDGDLAWFHAKRLVESGDDDTIDAGTTSPASSSSSGSGSASSGAWSVATHSSPVYWAPSPATSSPARSPSPSPSSSSTTSVKARGKGVKRGPQQRRGGAVQERLQFDRSDRISGGGCKRMCRVVGSDSGNDSEGSVGVGAGAAVVRYCGTSYRPDRLKWQAQVTVKGMKKKVSLGEYHSPEVAAAAFNYGRSLLIEAGRIVKMQPNAGIPALSADDTERVFGLVQRWLTTVDQ